MVLDMFFFKNRIFGLKVNRHFLHRIHGTGLFTYMNDRFLLVLVNVGKHTIQRGSLRVLRSNRNPTFIFCYSFIRSVAISGHLCSLVGCIVGRFPATVLAFNTLGYFCVGCVVVVGFVKL